MGKSYNNQMLKIKDAYLASGGSEPIDLDDLAEFAIKQNMYVKDANQVKQLCKRDFARAFREQYHTDEQGREIRTFHAVKSSVAGQQQVFWADLRTAKHEHMIRAFAQRRRLILGECVQLKNDADSYNENINGGPRIQMCFDFEEDIREMNQPKTFDDSRS